MSALPAGTLTLLFTDIEGSSRRWEHDAELMRAALAEHDRIIPEVVAGAGGTLIKHTGDGFAAVFGTATDAARAAIEVQRRLQTDPWEHGERLLVRQGLHTGDISPTEGDYFGPVANRAARTMDVANGNQISCSSTTAALLTGIDVRSEGHHELRGIGIEEIFLVLSDEIEVDDRPFRLPVEPSNLPSIHTSFLGREADVKRTVEFLEGASRVVSILGPGGVGKTRLAIEVGGEARAAYPGGVHFCDLAPVGDHDAVAESIAEVVGARRQPGMTLVQSISDFVRGLDLLLIFDSCEHVIEAVRTILDDLAGIEGVDVLVTSREALGLAGEQLVVLAPLPPDGAGVELFVQRARERDTSFALDDANRDDVYEIVRRLDGIPLAVELAAAWVRVMSPAELVDRLDDRFRLLRGGRRGERQETLRDTVRWSYDLLTPTEAALFARLCVFAGGFTLAAAEYVCADDDAVDLYDVPDLLMALVDKSMVVPEPGSKLGFSMLETLRRFGEEVLAGAEESILYRTRHADYYRELALAQNDRLFTAAEADAWLVLDHEWDNLRVALDTFEAAGDTEGAAGLVTALVWFATFSMRFELFRWADELLALEGIESSPYYTDLCGAAALGAYFTTEPRAQDLARAGLDHDQSDPLGFCRTALAAVYLNNVHLAEESAALTAAWLAAGPTTPGSRLWAEGFRTFHLCTYEPGGDGAAHAAATMGIARETGSPSAMAVAYWAEGQSVAMTDRDAGCAIWEAGLEWPRSLPGNHLVEHLLIGLLLHFQVRKGDLREVLALCESAVQSAVRQHYIAGASHLLGVTAITLARAGDPGTGARLLGAMVANGHLPRSNALKALQAEFGDELESHMALGQTLSVNGAAQLALQALKDAIDRLDAATDDDVR